MFSRIPNLRFFFHEMFLIFFNERVEVYYWNQKMILHIMILFYFQKRRYFEGTEKNRRFLIRKKMK